MKNLLLIFALLIVCNLLSANTKIDSLINLASKTTEKDKISLLMEIGNLYTNIKLDSALFYYDEAFSLSVKNDLADKTTDAIKASALIYYKQGKYNESIVKYNEAIKHTSENNTPLETATIYNQLGLVYIAVGNATEALNYIEKAIDIFKNSDHPERLIAPQTSLGTLHAKNGDYSSAKNHFQKAIKLGEVYNCPDESIDATIKLGKIHKALGGYSQAILLYNKALLQYINTNNIDGEASIYLEIASVYSNLKQYTNALKYATLSLNIESDFSINIKKAVGLNTIGNIYCDWEKFDSALIYFEKAILTETQLKDNVNLAKSFEGIGHVYCSQNSFEKALDQYFKAANLFNISNNKLDLANNYSTIGEVYYEKLNNKKEAYNYFLKAEEIFKQLNSNNNLGLLYLKMGRLELLNKNYDVTISHINQSIDFSPNNKIILLKSNELLGEAYTQLNQYKKANIAYKKALTIKDSVINDHYKIQYSNIESFITSEKTELEINKLKEQTIIFSEQLKRKKTSKNFLLVFSILLLISITSILYFYSKVKKVNSKLYKQQVKNEQQRKQLKDSNNKLVEAKEHAEKISGYKSEFLANISHEIRTPLNAITGYINLLQKQIDPTKTNTYLNNALIASGNLGIIINDLLDISKIEAGKMVIEKTEFNPIIIVTQAISTLKLKAEEKKIAIELHFDPLIPDSLLGDPYRLTQILINLINNAIKFSDAGEDISISVNCKEIQDQCNLEFNIKDRGIGIEENKLDHIFESFTQIQSNTARNKAGTGLGLAIVKRLIELQNGKISVKSKVDEGSSFTFSITYDIDLTPKPIDLPIIDPDVLKNQNIEISVLLVEDNEINQELAKDTILSWGSNYIVEIAENGRIAIDKLKTNQYNIVLMDIQMPEMDGHEATLYIRNQMDTPISNIPIIGMTAHALPHEKELAFKNGMNEYIIKPFNPDELQQKINCFVLNTKETK